MSYHEEIVETFDDFFKTYKSLQRSPGLYEEQSDTHSELQDDGLTVITAKLSVLSAFFWNEKKARHEAASPTAMDAAEQFLTYMKRAEIKAECTEYREASCDINGTIVMKTTACVRLELPDDPLSIRQVQGARHAFLNDQFTNSLVVILKSKIEETGKLIGNEEADLIARESVAGAQKKLFPENKL